MGCCFSKHQNSKASRVSRWHSTGVVACRDSKLKSFPSEVFELGTVVRSVDLSNNKIDGIPEEISTLANLQRLMLSNNIIHRVPINIESLQLLKVLNLDGNQISLLPDQIGQLIRVERISISRNILTKLPETIGRLPKLLLLNVSSNKIKAIPDSIGSCSSLEELQADDNMIEVLPTSLCQLAHLKMLSLNNNLVKKIPDGLLKNCKALQHLSLHGNPITADQFQQMEGFDEFESRRKEKYDKQIDSNVMMGSNALDEGVDF